MFDSELHIVSVGPRTWALTAPLIWTGTKGDTFVVPTGFVTDFATVPRILQWLVSPYGAYTRAAVLHDWLLVSLAEWSQGVLPSDGISGTPPANSRDCDGIFRRVMQDLGVAWSTRWLMWAAVRAASLGNPRRAYGRDFGRDALKVFAVGLVAVPVALPGVIGVVISLGLMRVLAPFGAKPVPPRPAGSSRREP